MAMNTCATRCPSDLSVEHLEAELTSWAGRLASAECRWLRLVVEYDRREAWRAWECRSCAHWLMWQCGLDLRSAREKVRAARALEDLPLVARSFEEGRLSYRKVRAVTAAARRAVRIRDRGCRFPGCSHRVRIDAHHVEHWANGGPTVSENLISLCRHHHRAVHEGGWSVHLDPDGHATFIGPDGAAVPDPSWPARSFDAADLDVVVEPDAIVPERSGDPIHLPYVVSVLWDAAHPPKGRFS